MDASAGGGGAQNSRKEWRVASEHHHSSHTASDGESDCLKVGQSDERTIYEVQQGRDPANVDFSSVTIEGGMQNDILQQRLNHVSSQREELQQMEVELRARVIARSEIMQIQNQYETQIKDHANIAALLQEQVMDRDQTILELERKIEEKDREIHAVKLDNEAAWAKEGLLREQNTELASFRRERDNSEVERAQHFQQIHDLQEHIKEKERQFLELQDQQRVAQETILFKDEQLREAQAWMTRAHEMDTLHSTTIHSLQAELRERTEQYNQLWVGCQRQFAEMERLHFNAMQQLLAELTRAQEMNGSHKDESAASHSSTKDATHVGHDNGHLEAGGSVSSNGKSSVVTHGHEENASKTFTQAEHGPSVPITPTMLGFSPYLPPGQMAVHPFLIQQQGVLNHASPHLPQNHAAHFQSVQPTHPIQYWQNQQCEMPADGQTHPQYVDAHISQGLSNGAAISCNTEDSKDSRPIGNSYMVEPHSQHDVQDISSRFQDTLNLNRLEESKEQEGNTLGYNDHEQESRQTLPNTHIGTDVKEVVAESNIGGTVHCVVISATETHATSVEKISDSLLLDERLLLACIARTMPASGKIRISSTLPNRLAKMLAPLQWHDYKKTYGKLEDFVAGHPELFVMEGDFIQLREGAQKKIAVTAAAAKIAAAASAPSPYMSALLPSVAVTPMAQTYRLRKSPSSEVDHINPHHTRAQHSDGVHYNVANTIGSSNARVHSNSMGRQDGRSPVAAPSSQR